MTINCGKDVWNDSDHDDGIYTIITYKEMQGAWKKGGAKVEFSECFVEDTRGLYFSQNGFSKMNVQTSIFGCKEDDRDCVRDHVTNMTKAKKLNDKKTLPIIKMGDLKISIAFQ